MSAALPELLEAIGRVDAGAAKLLSQPAPSTQTPPRQVLSVHPLVLLWASVLASAVLALFTVPRLEAFRDGLDAPPAALGTRALVLLLVCFGAAVAFTLAGRKAPAAPFRRRLLDALDGGKDAPSAVLAAAGVEGPVLSDGAVALHVARALKRGLGPAFGAAACALLEGQGNVERGLRVLAGREPDAAPERLAVAGRVAAVLAASANVAVTFLVYLKGIGA